MVNSEARPVIAIKLETENIFKHNSACWNFVPFGLFQASLGLEKENDLFEKTFRKSL